MLLLSHDGHQTVLSTTATGKSVQLGAVQDVNMTATTVAGQYDVTVAAGRDVTTTSDMKYDKRLIRRSSLQAYWAQALAL